MQFKLLAYLKPLMVTSFTLHVAECKEALLHELFVITALHRQLFCALFIKHLVQYTGGLQSRNMTHSSACDEKFANLNPQWAI